MVYGEGKAEAILGAMRAELLNTLIIDEKCTKKVLNLTEKYC